VKRARGLPSLALALTALLRAGALCAQSAVPVDVEVGYRWLDVTGNTQLYRSQINDQQGLLLRSLLYDSHGPSGSLDFFRVDASDLGAGPAGSFRLSAGRTGMFRIDFNYRHQDFYSALPAFANPFIDAGIVPGQQTYNRGRDIYDLNLQILPGAIVTPILGYTRNDYHGPGRTTYTLGGDDFALDHSIHATDQEYRAGLALHLGSVEAAVTQGFRRFRQDETETLSAGAGNGNGPGTVLDQPITASGITRSTTTSVDTPVTSAWITGRFLDRVKLTGSYVHAAPDGDASSLENDAGQFVSFQIQRLFAGLTDTIASKTSASWWRGSARAEIEVMPGIGLTGGWTEKSGTLEGTALISSLYLDTVTYAGQPVGNLLALLNTNNSIERTERLFDASASATLWSPLRINAGWSQAHQDVTATPDAAEIVIAGGQGGHYVRTVNAYGGGASFTMAGLTLGGDYRRDDADHPIFRTDFITRDRWKIRAAYAFGEIARVGGTWQETHATNDDVDIGYDTRVREAAADIEVTAVPKILHLHASAGYFQADRRILERAPQDFSIFAATQAELGHTWEGGATVTISRLSLDGSYIFLINGGSVPFVLKRARVRGEVSLTANLSLAAEWLKDQYSEQNGTGLAGPLANYNANRYYAGLHWKP
jgi:hypothetical protein